MTTAKTPSRLMTADELLVMERVPGKRYELLRGVLTEKEVPTGDPHGATVSPVQWINVPVHRDQ